MRLACIHGIRTAGPDRYSYAPEWQAALERAGIVAECVPVPWSSHGSIVADLGSWGVSAHNVDLCAAELDMRLDGLAVDGIIAHSAGAYLYGLTGHTHLPAVLLGSPGTHPLWSRWLSARRRARPESWANARAFASTDDGVAALHGRVREVPGLRATTIRTGSRGHDPEAYFDNAKVRAAIRALGEA